jgi:hypothetical protein
MPAPIKSRNFFPSVIAVPSLLANNFVIAESKAGYGILQMKAALLAMTGHLFFDAEDDEADFVIHGEGALIESTEGVTYGGNTKEQLSTISMQIETNTAEGSTAETARGTLEAMRHGCYDYYAFDNTAQESVVIKMVGVKTNITKPKLEFAGKVLQNLTGTVAGEDLVTDNILKATNPA